MTSDQLPVTSFPSLVFDGSWSQAERLPSAFRTPPPHSGIATLCLSPYLRAMPKRSTRRPSARQPMSVVTGAAGFLGSHMVDLLLAREHRVIGIDNFVTGSGGNIDHLGGNGNFKFIQQDVTEFLFLHEAVDYVWHFASPASPVDYLELPIQTLKVGSLG